MNTVEDDDLKLLRATTSLLADLERLLPRFLRSRKHGQRVREIDMYKLDPFQEDPQLLDTHLKTFIPPLVDAYIDTLRASAQPKLEKGYIPLSHAICQILNQFCKIRGEKVIKGFLNNEPRYLQPILNEFELGKNFIAEDGVPLPQSILPWTERYILLLWLSHLTLAPFPLASMSVSQSSQYASTDLAIDLPPELPAITLRILTICAKALKSATKERDAAANLLVKLCVRPDMQKVGLMTALVKWALSIYSTVSEVAPDIHQCLGSLSFLSGLVTSATNDEIGSFLPAIYRSCQDVLSQSSLASIRSSAVARKLIVKTLRNIVIHCLQDSSSSSGLDMACVEEVIEFLLESLGDGDTPVRYAASKALSVITMKLDPESGADIVEAIFGSLKENVYWQGTLRNLSGVNPLRWHGLTLTLSHLLYRAAIPTSQLPEILNALLLALTFEQRSATGGSIGTNVRDAACFGIWALSRRYTTNELLVVQTASVRASEHHKGISVLQVLAIELLVVACLDPAGNIRRGSSAALQELIGRHPNTVEEGIPLVQTIDFHAVGLRQRAMCDVAIKAGSLRSMYWESLFDNFLEWRGTGSLDRSSRESAARAIGLLSEKKSSTTLRRMADQICSSLKVLKSREVEERHGLVLSLAALANEITTAQHLEAKSATTSGVIAAGADIIHLWDLLDGVLNLGENSFTSPALRPELTTFAMCNFLGSMAHFTNANIKKGSSFRKLPTSEVIRLFNLCLGRHEDSILEAIPSTATGVIMLLTTIAPSEKDVLVAGWLSRLENEASYNGLRCSGFAIALGAAYSQLSSAPSDDVDAQSTPEQAHIIRILAFRCTSAVAIEARTVALQALQVLLEKYENSKSSNHFPQKVQDHVAHALHIALNDYTVTERGDVGSLVRLEALAATRTAWETGLLENSNSEEQLHADVLRLSLEKIDKIRTRAAHVLETARHTYLKNLVNGAGPGVSSYAYFSNALKVLQLSTSTTIKKALTLGFIGSAGMGSESVVQNARAALLDAVDALPTVSSNAGEDFSLQDLLNLFVSLLKESLETERVLLPLLDVLAFLFDMQIMHRLIPTSFNFRVLLSQTQKAHFKSTHMPKLHLALDMYRGLGTIPSTRMETIAKVANMLLHPFPKIRITAAETLWILTQEEELKRHDWSLPPKSLKPAVDTMKASLS